MTDILIISGGLVPQLVTETLYAIAQEANSPRARDDFWPSRVIVAGTASTQRVFEASELAIQVSALCTMLRQPEPALEILAPEGVEDIRTAEDANSYADFITRLIWELTSDEDVRLHVSLAGGRKTMTFHAGLPLLFYGRSKDRLSHTLLRPFQAELAANFWFPTTSDLLLVNRDGVPVKDGDGQQINARDVKIDLAKITYGSLRNRLSPKLLSQPRDHNDLQAQVDMSDHRTPTVLTLDTASRTLSLAGVRKTKKLPAKEFAFYRLLCEVAKNGGGGAGPSGIGGNHTGWLLEGRLVAPQAAHENLAARYAAHYKECVGKGSAKEEDRPYHLNTGAAVADAQTKLENDNKDYFRPIRSRLKAALDEWVEAPELRETLFDSIEEDGSIRLGVSIAAVDIRII